MLSELKVGNFALIESLALTFGSGFNTLTGETGAGKSIIVGAINLILGGRASAEQIRQGAEEAEVQALFTLDQRRSGGIDLAALGLPASDDVVVRRVLSRSGRHRAYVNGTLVTLSQLAGLGRDLVAVSGQHEHQLLLEPEWQLLCLDQFGGLMAQRRELGQAFQEWREAAGAVGDLEHQVAAAREKADLLEFQAREIKAASLAPGEDQELERERDLARDSEKIFSLVRRGHDQLYGRSGAALELLDGVRGDVKKAAGMDERLEPLAARIEEAFHQLADVAGELSRYRDHLVFDPARLEVVGDRLNLINRLKRKYGPSLEAVLDFGRQADGHLDHVAELSFQIKERRATAAAAGERSRSLAVALGAARREAADLLARRAEEEMRGLGLPHLRFEVFFRRREPDGEEPSIPGPTGLDEIEFLISPNVGEDLRPLARIASGGELSRIMLGLKTLLAGRERVQTLIFDEVDAGIGGAVADVVGRQLRRLADHHQVICITHLPQIAALGQHHYHVFKEVRDQRTVTGLKSLSRADRIEEIARMLGGAKPTAATRTAAREMLEEDLSFALG